MEGEEISVSKKPSKIINSLIKSLNILVVDDDSTCLSIVAAILKSWNYQVVTMKHPNDALKALKTKGSSFDLVITDVHMPDMDGYELQKQIDQHFQLPVVFMSADDQDIVMIKGLQNGASFFITKPVSPHDLRHLWQYAFANKKGKVIIEELEATRETPNHEKPCDENILIPKTISPIANDASNEEEELKMKFPIKEDIKDVYNMAPKKKKFVWTKSLHSQFLEAIRSLRLEKAVPKKILEIMNVPGLTREHVASHLQKYRLFVKKVPQTSSKIQHPRLQPGSAPVLSSNSLSRKHSLGGYFPLLKSPKLGLQSSFNHRQHFIANSTPRFGDDISNLLYNGNNSKQSMFGSSKSFLDTNNFVFKNKPDISFYGDFSKRVIIDQEKPQVAQNVINSGLSTDMPSFEKIRSFNKQNFDFHPNFSKLAKLGTFGNKWLDGSTSFVFENEIMNGIGNENLSTIPVLGVSYMNYENQPIFEMTPQHQNDNNGGDDMAIFGQLNDLSDSGSNCFPKQFDDQADASFTWLNQNNIQSQIQILQSGGGNELIPDVDFTASPSADQLFQPFHQNSFQIEDEEFLKSLFSPGKDGGDRQSGTF